MQHAQSGAHMGRQGDASADLAALRAELTAETAQLREESRDRLSTEAEEHVRSLILRGRWSDTELLRHIAEEDWPAAEKRLAEIANTGPGLELAQAQSVLQTAQLLRDNAERL